jgi:hypothetical protein
MDPTPSVEVTGEFHRRMAAIIQDVQAALERKGVHELLGYATDYAFGDQRGVQTLVLKRRHRSAYVRLQWETIMSDSVDGRQQVGVAVDKAVLELT